MKLVGYPLYPVVLLLDEMGLNTHTKDRKQAIEHDFIPDGRRY